MFKNKSVQSLITEFILIISGILISLFVQNKFEERQQKAEGIRILGQIANDLKLDTALFTSNLKSAGYLMDQYKLLLSKKGNMVKDPGMPAVVEGVLATDSKVLTMINRGGYLRFTSFGQFELYRQPELINDILHYYNNQNEMLNSFSEWDSNYVKDQVVGYYLSHHTGNLRRYFEQSILHDSSRAEDAMMMRQMLDDPDFQSIQVYNYIIKMNYYNQLQEAREEAVRLLIKLQNLLPAHD
ncbi:MAG: hypothetical protein JST46_15815 [Bacteroidetes bacterium]|nr:hypothetical protein [Bacteroidota bacterium]